jgi:D-glycero-alpha-D-manno-heptose-7-phosphate kinase
MIITRTPLRISFIGGGTDFQDFFCDHGGAVISMAIDKYIYVSVNEKFDGKIRLSYSKTENVDDPEELQHDLASLTLQLMQEKGLEITSVADIPGEGSGLGSSSAFLVGLLLAISGKYGQRYSPHILAENAFMIESMLAGHSVGKQDHYAAAYGGLKFYEFQKNTNVRITPFCLLDEELNYILQRTMLFWTGKGRKAEPILKRQKYALNHDGKVIHEVKKIKELAMGLKQELDNKNFDAIGPYILESWEHKKKMADGISFGWVDELMDKAQKYGASGCKLCGAGGGGFMLVYAEPEYHEGIETKLGLRRVPIRLDEKGSTVIHNDRENHA